MTSNEPEYKILYYLNDKRNECYFIDDNALRVGLFEIPEAIYKDKILVMENTDGTIGHKTLEPFGWTITTEGKKRLNILETEIQIENAKLIPPKHWKDKYWWLIGLGGIVLGIFTPGLSGMATKYILRQNTEVTAIDTVETVRIDTVRDTVYFPDSVNKK